MTDPINLPINFAPATQVASPAAAAQVQMLLATEPANPTPTSDTLDTGFGWPTTRQAWSDIAQRAAFNGVQAAGPLLLALFGIGGTNGLDTQFTARNWLLVLTLFATAAVVSVAKNVAAWKVVKISPKGWRVDTLIGVATAFVGALAGYIVADPLFDFTRFDWVAVLRLSAGAAILSLGKMTVWPAVKNGINLANLQAAYAGPAPSKAKDPEPQHAA